jgi:hypothetical protein
MAKTYPWIIELAKQVALDEGRTDVPEIKLIRQKYGFYCSGHTHYHLDETFNKITIAKGKHAKKKEIKLVVLHEIAHWLMPYAEHHSEAFWDKAFELYRRYKIPMYYARRREGEYRKSAYSAYKKNRKEVGNL